MNGALLERPTTSTASKPGDPVFDIHSVRQQLLDLNERLFQDELDAPIFGGVKNHKRKIELRKLHRKFRLALDRFDEIKRIPNEPYSNYVDRSKEILIQFVTDVVEFEKKFAVDIKKLSRHL